MAYRLGRQPMMMDFVRFGDKDPALFVAKKESFLNLFNTWSLITRR